MYIKKEYSLLSEALSKVALKAYKDGENDLGDILSIVYSCYISDIEKELLEIIKEAGSGNYYLE